MYRDYEDPRELERAINEWGRKYEQARDMGASAATLQDIHEYIYELEQRAALAWEDEDYDACADW